MGGQLRPAAQARPEARALGLGGVAEEAAVLAPGHAHLAHRPAIDTGGGDADEEAAVEACVARLQGEVAGVGLKCRGIGVHAPDDTQHPRRG